MRRRAQRARERQLRAVTGALALSALVAAALALLQRRRSSARAAHASRVWQCECGQAFRIAGLDRHRVYWLPDAPANDPIISGRCPACDRPLPAGADRE